MTPENLPSTFGDLKASGYTPVGVKDEMRRNLITMLRADENAFPGVLGYEESVVPQIENAILAKHDILLLGLRGQAKTRMARLLVNLLDEHMPCVPDCPLRSSPYEPLTKIARLRLAEQGDDMPIEWVHRSERYREKLATPDVSIADLIGDVDPIKAVSRKLDLSDEEVIHYGIIPRSNRGLFCINELPDLQARIQVGLLNILEEKDVQIRGFPIRMALDLAIVFTANPEDYTNRGNIITPLKDRIDAQILTHYPTSIDIGMAITAQEAWTDREGLGEVKVPALMRELVEQTAIEARDNDYVDKGSDVSARMPISLYETLISVVERRMVICSETAGLARIHDVHTSVPAISGKVELIYKGEQEGIGNVAFHLVGRAIRSMFNKRFVPDYQGEAETKYEFPEFQPVLDWFDAGNSVDLGDSINHAEYTKRLRDVPELEKLARGKAEGLGEDEIPLFMEFILEGLHQNFMLTKRFMGKRVVYTDALSSMIGN